MTPIPIHACNPGPMTGAGNWTWLLKGPVSTLIDAGSGEPAHRDAVAAALDGAPLQQVIVTHGHGDHASGAPALAERFPDARFFKFPWPGRDEKWPVRWLPLADGDTIAAGNTTLTVVHTPGHAPDHICLWHEATSELFAADLAMETGSIYIPSQVKGGDLRKYLLSLARVIALGPRRLLPAHGAVIEAPVELLRSFITHREARERQVLTALADGLTSADAILGRIYPDIRPAMLAFARDTVVAHLEKLGLDGRVQHLRGTDAWLIIEP